VVLVLHGLLASCLLLHPKLNFSLFLGYCIVTSIIESH